MSEGLILDPEAVDPDRVEVDITKVVGEAGPDFGDAQIEAYRAQAERGQLPVDFRLPNRQIHIPLMLTDRQDGRTFDDIRRQVQAKAALFQQRGGSLQRDTRVGSVYADVVDATLKLGAGFFAAAGEIDPDAVLTLECLPDWYGDEVALDAIVKQAGVTFPEITDVLRLNANPAMIAGDYHGRCRIVVKERGGEDQRGVFWAFRSRYYDAAATARLVYEAEALTPLDSAAVGGGAAPAWGSVVRHSALATSWTPILSTKLLAGGDLTHVGTYRLLARVRARRGTKVRVLYDVGDMTMPTENPSWTAPGSKSFEPIHIADLGQIRLDRAPIGAHRWRGHIQAMGAAGGETIEIDRLWLQPVDESAGRLSVPIRADNSLTSYAIRDAFNQAAGALNGKALQIGAGSWGGAGDSDGFTVETTGHTAQRTAVSDTAGLIFGASPPDPAVTHPDGRFAIAGSAVFTDVVAQVAVRASSLVECQQGLVVRYVNTTNYLAGVLSLAGGYAAVIMRTTAPGDIMLGYTRLPFTPAAGVSYTVRVYADAQGHWALWAVPPGGTLGTPLLAGHATWLETGDVLASGKTAMFDGQDSATASTRNYDDYAAWVPVGDAALYADGVAELRTDGMFREIESGYGYGPVTPTGDLPRIPPSGLENNPVELLLKTSRGDLVDLPDSGLDDLTVQVFYRPSWLFLPEA